MQRSPADLIDVLAFTRVVETGSFARAAERMALSKPVLSRRVARLEEKLGARLLTRNARGAQPTEIGKAYYARAANIFAELEAAEEVVAEAVTQLAGPIRLTAPLSFGITHLAPALAEFAAAHPRIELDIALEDRTVDLTAGGYDLAVRIGRLADSALIARRIAPIRKAVVASSAYLDRRGRPERPAEIGGHDVLLYANEHWRFQVGKRWETIRSSRARHAAPHWRHAARRGRGGPRPCMLPSFIARPALEAGSVEVLLRGYPLEEGALHAVVPPGRATTARVRALVDFLVTRFGPEPAWDPCWLAQEAEAGRGKARR